MKAGLLGWVCGFALVLGVVPAHARQLNLINESFAPYLRGGYQMSNLKKSSFADSSGTGNEFSGDLPFIANYEFGFVWAIKEISLRFGFEVIRPRAEKGISATNASGTELFTVDTDVSGYVPRLGVDINIKQWPSARIFLNASYGMANVTVQNSYGFTTAGQAAYSLANFREEVKGSAALQEYALGWEYNAFDTTTIVLDAGYRNLKLDGLSHNVDVTNFQGAVTKGSSALNNTGGNRALDLSGYFASLHLRFWL